MTDTIRIFETVDTVLKVYAGTVGPKGDTGDSTLTASAGEDVGGHRAVYLAADGKVYYADNSESAQMMKFVGITKHAAVTGAQVKIQTSDVLEDESFSLTPDQFVYVGANGLFTQTIPQNTWAKIVGTAVTDKKILINIEEAYFNEA